MEVEPGLGYGSCSVFADALWLWDQEAKVTAKP